MFCARLRAKWSELWIDNQISEANCYQKLVDLFIAAWDELDPEVILRAFSITGIVPRPKWPYDLPGPPVMALEDSSAVPIAPVRPVVPQPDPEPEAVAAAPRQNAFAQLMANGQRLYNR